MKRTQDHQKWDSIIEKRTSLFDLKLRDIWSYNYLLLMFVRRDFVSSFRQTILGPIWFFVQPLLTTLTYVFVFGDLAGLSSDGLPKPLFYMAGIISWNYFSDCLTKTSVVFSTNAGIFGKVYFPRIIVPLSIIISNLMRLLVQMLLFIFLMFFYYYKTSFIGINYMIVVVPYLILLLAFLGLGVGLVVTSLTTKYKDLQFLIQFGVTLVMYSTTVIYPFSFAPEELKGYIILNPLTSIIEAFRFAFLGKGNFSFWTLGYSTFSTVLVLIFGILIFNRTERNFVDTI